MQQITHTTTKNKLLFVELANDIEPILVNSIKYFGHDTLIADNKEERRAEHIELPQGDWQLIGKCSEITEDIAKGIVDSDFISYKNYNFKGKPSKDCMFGCAYYQFALQSFNSLIEHLGIDTKLNYYLLKAPL